MLTNRKSNKTLEYRLNRIVLVVVLTFVLLALILFFISRRVCNTIDCVVEGSLQQTITSSQNSRDFSLLNARLNILKATFTNDDKWYAAESKGVLADIKKLQSSVGDDELLKTMQQLKKRYLTYLKSREWVNYLLYWRSEQDQDLDELFLLLQEVIGGKIVAENAKTRGETASLEQLLTLTHNLRISLFEITKINAAENPARLLVADNTKFVPLEIELTALALQLNVLTTAVSPINRLGQHLLDHFIYYQHQMEQYRQEMVFLGELDRNLNENLAQILVAMDHLDKHTITVIESTKLEINRNLLTMGTVVQIFLILLAALVWFYLRAFLREHIQIPMSLLGNRLAKFEQGDSTSLINLDRDDEWDEIEIVFNQMIVSLQKNNSALQKSEKRYRDNFDNASDGLFHIGVSGKVLRVNRALIALFGFDVNFSGSVPVEHGAYTLGLMEKWYCHPVERKQWLELLRQNRTVQNFEVEFNRLDGETFWGSISGHLVAGEGGKEDHVEGAIRDITQQRKAHEELQKLQIYLQNIIDSMPSILIGVDNKMIVTMWNQRAVEESLLAAKDAKGYAMETVCHLFDLNAFMPQLEKTLKTRQPIWLHKVESRKKSKTGSQRFFDIMIYPVTAEGTAGAVIYMIDTTEKLQMEEMMVRSEKMQSIGGLAAGLAHEINNPLAVILQNVQVLDRRLSPNLSKNCQVANDLGTTMETITEYAKLRGCMQVVHSIADAGQRVAKIVANIQSFSRSGTSTQIPCSIPDLIERTLELVASDHDMRSKFNFRKITINRDFNKIEDVCCEPSQIQQVLFSLFKNAAQALVERSEEREITLVIAPVDTDHIRLQICDNGMGMAPEVVNRIFDPFYTTQDVGAGFGLGLSIAYFIITHNHNGSLKVTSELGVGSCFEIILPLIQTEDEEQI